jgi:NAD(P)H-hydrate repair Nnr-like enzyme with NAD(P)H-hydrate epimerase domain
MASQDSAAGIAGGGGFSGSDGAAAARALEHKTFAVPVTGVA